MAYSSAKGTEDDETELPLNGGRRYLSTACRYPDSKRDCKRKKNGRGR